MKKVSIFKNMQECMKQLLYWYSDRVMTTFNPDVDYKSGIIQGTKIVWVIKNVPGIEAYLIIYKENENE